MSTQRMTRILCVAEPRGSGPVLDRLLRLAAEHDVQGIALVGDLSGPSGIEGYREVFRMLAQSGLPAYWVPGPGDAPLADYVYESHNAEVAFPSLRGVHGSVAFASGNVLVAGLGGEISDDPETPTENTHRVSYARWEAEYRLGALREFAERELVLLLWTQPAHRGLRASGSEAVAEVVRTYRPRLVICGGERGTEMLGRSVIVAPGPLHAGHYAVANLHTSEARLQELPAAVP